MSYTVKQLREILKKEKTTTKACAPTSRMNKAELMAHARTLGLLSTPSNVSQPVQPAQVSDSPFFKKILGLKKLAEGTNPTSINGKKKKSSVLRRIERVLASDADKGTDAEQNEIIMKLSKNLNSLYMAR